SGSSSGGGGCGVGAGSDTEPGTPGSRTNVLGKVTTATWVIVLLPNLGGGGTCRTPIRNFFQIVALRRRSPASSHDAQPREYYNSTAHASAHRSSPALANGVGRRRGKVGMWAQGRFVRRLLQV